MTSSMLAGLRPTHPGEVLREDVLPATGKGKAEIARMLGLSRQHLYDILNEKKPITTNVALRLGRLFGNAPAMWLNMQQAFDLRTEADLMREELDRIPTLKAA